MFKLLLLLLLYMAKLVGVNNSDEHARPAGCPQFWMTKTMSLQSRKQGDPQVHFVDGKILYNNTV